MTTTKSRKGKIVSIPRLACGIGSLWAVETIRGDPRREVRKSFLENIGFDLRFEDVWWEGGNSRKWEQAQCGS